MILGIYDIYLNAIANINLSILFPMGIGLVLGGLVFLKIIQYLIKKFFSQTYYTIIGFVLGSLLILYPGIEFNLNGIVCIFIFFISCYIGKILE